MRIALSSASSAELAAADDYNPRVFAGSHRSSVGAVAIIAIAIVAVDSRAGMVHQESGSSVADRVTQLTRDTRWTLVATTRLAFRTFHPQGLVKIGDHFFVSSVEVRVATKRFETPLNGYDRDTGEGLGHLFKVDALARS